MPRPHDTPLGDWIRTLRKQRGWSHDQLARQLGPPATRQTVIRWEKGSQPGNGYVSRLAAVFGEPEEAFQAAAQETVEDRLEELAAAVEEMLENQREILILLRDVPPWRKRRSS